MSSVFLVLVQLAKCWRTFSLIVFGSVMIFMSFCSVFSISLVVSIHLGCVFRILLIIFFGWSCSCSNLRSLRLLIRFLVSCLIRLEAIFLSVRHMLWTSVSQAMDSCDGSFVFWSGNG